MIEKNSELYLKRLARELKLHWVNGFLSCGQRWNQAKFSNGKLWVKWGIRKWEDGSNLSFFDAVTGKEIVASRS